MLGLNAAAMIKLITTCLREAEHIQRSVSDVSSTMSSTWWQGPDASRFREAWMSQYQREALSVAEALMTLGASLRTELEAQQNVSRG